MIKLTLNEASDGVGDSSDRPFVMHFDKAIWKENADDLDDGLSVIYFVYSCWEDNDKNKHSHLLYIGQAEDLKKRIKQHNKKPETVPNTGSVTVEKLGDYLCDLSDVTRGCFYAYAEVDGRLLDRYEAAAIKVFQPEINIKNKKTLECHLESWFKCVGNYAYKANIVQHALRDHK